jgi:hypothetical protein
VVRCAGKSHATALVLVTMLAWPWNVALSSLEAAHAGPSVGLLVRSEPGQRVNRPCRKAVVATHALLPADTEQGKEGDAVGPPDSSDALQPATFASTLLPSAARPVPPVPACLDRPDALLCRLRC